MDLLLLLLPQVPRAAPPASVVKQRVVVDTVDVVDEDETKNNFPLRLLNNTYNRIYKYIRLYLLFSISVNEFLRLREAP